MRDDSRIFPRSWGAEFLRPGEVLFRTWAPGHAEIGLELHGSVTAMNRTGAGWHELLADGVEPGAAYRFRLPDGLMVPDPASRAQAGDVHSASLVIDPTGYEWRNTGWQGRPWEEAVICELHTGTFTPQGTFEAAADKLSHLARLGVTAIELMPVAQFAGNRGWGYDGVLPYAPHPAYGGPNGLKRLVDEAHGHGIMALLDVVYNHFGPEGAYIHALCPEFFDAGRQTPWGPAIDFSRGEVRDFLIENALYWLTEFGFDGLRLDAVDQTDDAFLEELARRVREEDFRRPIHLTTEDNRNEVSLHERGDGGRTRLYSGEWNDDFHNAAHAALTGEREGYYEDFAGGDAWRLLARSLAEGFAFQGEHSVHANAARGQPSGSLPPAAFVDFLQNHDQTGNRALGERLTALAEPAALKLMRTILLLSPHIPLMFMGEEWEEERPFLFFTDFSGELAEAVRSGRRKEFARFEGFSGQALDIPDPNDRATFERSRIDWSSAWTQAGREAVEWTRRILDARRAHVTPHLAGSGSGGSVAAWAPGMLAVDWPLNGAELHLRASFATDAAEPPGAPGQVFWREETPQTGGFVVWSKSPD